MIESLVSPSSINSPLIINAVVRDMLNECRILVQTAREARDSELKLALDWIEESLEELRWLFQMFVIYPRKRSSNLKELVEVSGELIEKDGMEFIYDQKMLKPGDAWDPNLKRRLEEVDFIVALLCPEFTESDYITTVEAMIALKRITGLECMVIPIHLSKCDLKNPQLSVLSSLQWIPGEPLLNLQPATEGRAEYLKGYLVPQILESIGRLRKRDSAEEFVKDLKALLAGRKIPPEPSAALKAVSSMPPSAKAAAEVVPVATSPIVLSDVSGERRKEGVIRLRLKAGESITVEIAVEQ